MTRTIMKKNCWEFKKCKRMPGGTKASEFGACHAATATNHNGKNGGKNAGRYCWRLTGTLCGDGIQGVHVLKMQECIECDFYKKVRKEEGVTFIS